MDNMLISLIKKTVACEESDFGEHFMKIYELYQYSPKSEPPFNAVCQLPENNIKRYLLGLFYCLGFGCKANLKMGYDIFVEFQKNKSIIANTCIAFVHLAMCRDKYESYDGTDDFMECDIKKGIEMFYDSIEKGDNLSIILFHIAWNKYTFTNTTYQSSIDRSVLANICAKGAAKKLPSAIRLIRNTDEMIGHMPCKDRCEFGCKDICTHSEIKKLLKYLVSSYRTLIAANNKIDKLQREILALRTHIEFAPGGEGYLSAKTDFEEHVRNICS